MVEIIVWAIYLLMAFGAAVILVLVFGGSLYLVGTRGEGFVPWIFPFIVLSVPISTVLTGRDVDAYVRNTMLAASAGDLGASIWLLRLLLWPLLVICVAFIFVELFLSKGADRAGSALFWSFVGYFIGETVLSGLFGYIPSLDHKMLYGPVLVSVFYFARHTDPAKIVHLAKTSGLASLVLAAMAALIYPKIAVQSNFTEGLLPWPRIRLWGLDSHANTLGPLSATVLLMEIGRPYARRTAHLFALGLAFAVLILTQSKTAWVSCLGGSLVFFLGRAMSGIDLLTPLHRQRLVRALPGIVGGVCVIGAVAGFFILNMDERAARFLSSSEGARFSTLTGRSNIWDITMGAWAKNYVFGYGPSLWGPKFAASYLLLGTASNGHNQIVDLLGRAGWVGLVAFLVYFVVLVRYVWMLRPVLGLLPVALLVSMIVRSIPEVPFRILNVQSSDFFLHLTILALSFEGVRQLVRTRAEAITKAPERQPAVARL